jgi:thrombospondin type 3 repeat protein
MSKALRVALPVLLAGILCIGFGTTSARADCSSVGGAPIMQGLGTLHNNFTSGGSYQGSSCGTSPSFSFWSIGHGNPNVSFPVTVNAGVDSGSAAGIFYDPFSPTSYVVSSDWANPGFDGCILDPSVGQTDGSVGPQGVLLSSGFQEGTRTHFATYHASSMDFDYFFNSFNLDYANDAAAELSCAAVPAPVIHASNPAGTSANLTWGGVSSIDDCAINNVDHPISSGDCTGAGSTRPLQSGPLAGWKVYSKEAPCTVGTLTGVRSGWTAEGGTLAIGANAQPLPGIGVTVTAAAPGRCRFLAISPVWDSGFEGKYISAQAGPLGGAGDKDGDGISDLTDTCPDVANANNSDTDGDGTGNICDNCPANSNPDQADSDNDGKGDVCDICQGGTTDLDGDGICSDVDNCPNIANPGQEDADHDGLGDVCDTQCPNDPTNDADADGFCGGADNCPTVYNPSQTNTDTLAGNGGDEFGDACDACPYEALNDEDGDSVCACDPKIFNADLCPLGGLPGSLALGRIYDNCPSVDNLRKVCNASPATVCTGDAGCQLKFCSSNGNPCVTDAQCPTGQTCNTNNLGPCVLRQVASGFGDGYGDACDEKFPADSVTVKGVTVKPFARNVCVGGFTPGAVCTASSQCSGRCSLNSARSCTGQFTGGSGNGCYGTCSLLIGVCSNGSSVKCTSDPQCQSRCNNNTSLSCDAAAVCSNDNSRSCTSDAGCQGSGTCIDLECPPVGAGGYGRCLSSGGSCVVAGKCDNKLTQNCTADIQCPPGGVCLGSPTKCTTAFDPSNPLPTPTNCFGGTCNSYAGTCSAPHWGVCASTPHDQGFGDCTVNWRTSQEFNCPTFRVSAKTSGAHPTGIELGCTNCTGGKVLAQYGGLGLPISKCKGGNMVVSAIRSQNNPCGKVLYKTAIGRPVFRVGTRVR